MIFIDSNVPMYVAGRDHPSREPARRFLARVRSRSVKACTSTEVLQEILYRYDALDRRELGLRVYHLFAEICPVVFPVQLADMDRATELLTGLPAISVRDAVHAAVMLNHQVAEVASFDRDFERIPGIERIALEVV